MTLFKEKKDTPGGLGAKGKGPDLYSSARKVQKVSRGWWNSATVKKARRDLFKRISRQLHTPLEDW